MCDPTVYPARVTPTDHTRPPAICQMVKVRAGAASTAGNERWIVECAFVVHSSPAVNSNESPGRKKPINKPVSANRMTNTPSAPRLDSTLCGSSRLTASGTRFLQYGWGERQQATTVIVVLRQQ